MSMMKKLDTKQYLDQYITGHPGVAVKTAITLYPDQLNALREMAEVRHVSVAKLIRGMVDYALSQLPERVDTTEVK